MIESQLIMKVRTIIKRKCFRFSGEINVAWANKSKYNLEACCDSCLCIAHVSHLLGYRDRILCIYMYIMYRKPRINGSSFWNRFGESLLKFINKFDKHNPLTTIPGKVILSRPLLTSLMIKMRELTRNKANKWYKAWIKLETSDLHLMCRLLNYHCDNLFR